MSSPLLAVKDLSISIDSHGKILKAVEGVSFDLQEGEVLGLVGESGCGKTLTCRALLCLLPSQSMFIDSGEILIESENILKLKEPELEKIRGHKIGMIFQNPASHLDPVMTIGKQISASFRLSEGLSHKEGMERAIELLQQVGIPDPAQRVNSYAHELSGGMKQRAMIAASIARHPKILIADEPTTALDVTVQAQILRLLLDIRDRTGLSIILVSHDLGVVSQICDNISVMYAGKMIEHGPKKRIMTNPLHPYTKGLIASQPGLAPPLEPLISIPDQPPTLFSMPTGCRFHPRCSYCEPICKKVLPPWQEKEEKHFTTCHFA